MNSAIAVSPTQTLTPGLLALQPKPVPAEMKVPSEMKGPKRKRSATGNCPDGLPDTLDLTELAGHLAKLSEARRLADKGNLGRATKHLSPQHRKSLLDTFPGSTRELEKLSSKHLRLVMMASISSLREGLAQKCFDSKRLEDVVEVWLINRWLKARVDKSASMLARDIREEGSKAAGILGLVEPPPLYGEDAVIGGLASKLTGSGLDNLVRGMVARGWIRSMYQDIYDDNQYADKAAAAVFALASLLDCRWPLDLVHQQSAQMHAKHYHSMETFKVHSDMSVARDAKFQPLPFNLKSPEIEAIFNLMATRPLMQYASQGLQTISEDLHPVDEETGVHGLEAVLSGFGVMMHSVEVFESVVKVFRSKVISVASATLQGKLAELIDCIDGMHEGFRAIFTEFDRDDNKTITSIAAAKHAIEEFNRNFDGVIPGREGVLMKAATDALNDITKEQNYLLDLNGEGEAIREEVTGLAADDPIRNRDKISACYNRLEAMAGDLEKANSAMGDWAARTERFVGREIEEWRIQQSKADHEQKVKQAQNQSEADVVELLEEAAIESQEMASRNLELKARVESLESGLASQRNAQANEGMSEEVREAMQLAMTGGNALTPAQVLLLVKAVYPHTEILPTAWSSAHDALIFEQTDRLWETLSTLAGKYTDAIVSGTPDTEARKMFTAYEYAANESETTAAGQLRKHREFRYQGELVYFDKHLKIGVAQDARKTIRVHFKIVAGVLVIAYCGGHRKL